MRVLSAVAAVPMLLVGALGVTLVPGGDTAPRLKQ